MHSMLHRALSRTALALHRSFKCLRDQIKQLNMHSLLHRALGRTALDIASEFQVSP